MYYILGCLYLIVQIQAQCNSCGLFLSQADCESENFRPICKWKQNLCIQKICKDYMSFNECQKQTDDGMKCYWSEKRGCSLILSGCTSLQNCSSTNNYCKPVYNNAFCVDEIQYVDSFCYEKEDELACNGQDESDETSSCQWFQSQCNVVSKSSSCAQFQNLNQCEQMWGCTYYNDQCVKSNCSYYDEPQCNSFARLSQFKYTPCLWDSNGSQCLTISPKNLTNLTCQSFTNGTYTWNSQKQVCQICQGKESMGQLIMVTLMLIINQLY